MIFPKLYQPEKSQPKQSRVFFISSVAVGLFLERAQCCSINSTHHNPALHISRHKAGAVQACSGAGTRWNALSGKYFRAGTALRQISLATGGPLLVRLALDQFIFWPKLPPNAGFGIKNRKQNFRQ